MAHGKLEGTTEQAPAPHPAALTSRLLAAFIDYLVLQALIMALGGLLARPELSFIAACALSLLYFGVGNSHITGGSTLGKRAFGLSVVSIRTREALTLAESGYRCCFQIILPVLLTELPPLYYRSVGLVGSPRLLEAPMALVLVYTFWNASLILVHKLRRAGHDLIAGSVVLQVRDASSDASTTPLAAKTAGSALHPLQLTLSVLLGLLLWFLSVQHPPAVSQIHRVRYALEKKLPLRIISIQSNETLVYIQLLALRATEPLNAAARATAFCEELRQSTSLPDEIATLRIELFLLPEVTEVYDGQSPLTQEFRLVPSTCATAGAQPLEERQ